jgi:peptide/nickel transport system permease protein
MAAPGNSTTGGAAVLRRVLAPLRWLPALLFAAFLLAALLAPVIAPYDPVDPAPGAAMLMPLFSEGYPLGTDSFGRDQLSRLLYGAQPLVLTALFATLLALVAGGLVGLVAGVQGGWTEAVVMRALDVLMSFPLILAAILVVAALGATIPTMVLAIGLSLLPLFARLAHALAKGEAARDYVLAARALGLPQSRIMLVEILPNIAPGLIVQATSAVSTAALTSAALSYLGLGVQPPVPDWGYMVRESQEFIFFYPEQALIPGILIALFSLACAFLGDLVNDAMGEDAP